MVNGLKKIPVAVASAGLLMLSMGALAGDVKTAETVAAKATQVSERFKHKTRRVYRGRAVTGFNRLFGQPITDLGPFDDFGYDTVGVYNPTGTMANALTADSADDALVATVLDGEFLSSHGLKTLAEVPAELLNVPLRNVGMNGFYDGLSYLPRPDALAAERYRTFAPGQAYHTGDITVADWLSARGNLKFVCRSNGTSRLTLRLKNLIPHRIYSVWGFFNRSEAMPFDNFGPVRPLAGLPNMVVSDDDGKGLFKRDLNFCPMNLAEDEVALGAVFVNYHSDMETNAGVLSFTDFDRYPGTSTHTQLFFPIGQ